MRTTPRGPLRPIFDGTRKRYGVAVGNSQGGGPTACATFDVDPGDAFTFDFDGSCSTDPNGSIVQWGWLFGDGNSEENPTPTTSHTYALPGTYDAYLIVMDDDNLLSAPFHMVISVTGNVPPTACFTFDTDQLDVDLDGSCSTDADGSIVLWSWDFGDGNTADEVTATTSHTYATDGTYDVCLVVTDDLGGTSTAFCDSVTVSATPALITLIPWQNAYWVEGPEFLALALADGAAVSNWPDEISTIDLTQATGSAQPAYDTSEPTFNNRPVIHFAAGDFMPQNAVVGSCATLVAIYRLHALGTNRWHDNQGSGGGGRWVMGTFSGTWQVYYGGSAGQSVAGNTNTHLFRNYQNASLDVMEIDGTLAYGPANYGTSVMTRMNVGNSGTHAGVDIAFLGLYVGDVSAHANWAAFKAAVASHYGLTIA